MNNRLMPTTNAPGLIQTAREPEYFTPPRPEREAEHVISFGHYAWLLKKHWWKIALATVLFTALTAVVTSRLTPLYEGVAKISIDEKISSQIISDGSVQTGGNDADQLFTTEVALIQSDGVLRPVAEQFGLMMTDAKTSKLPGGMSAADAPVSLKHLIVTHPANTFLISIAYQSTDPRKAAAVANAVAHSYITHGMEMQARSSLDQSAFMVKQIAELKRNMDDSAQALSGYEKQLGLINADQKTSILQARMLQLNQQYNDAANDRMQKEADYRAVSGGSSAAVEVSSQAAALGKLEEQMHSAQEKMAVAQTTYGPNYPEYKRAANELAEVTRQYHAMQTEAGKRVEVQYNVAKNREAMLRQSLLQAKGESDALNASSYKYDQLKHEAESNRTLYDELFKKVKEAGINGGFQSTAIRIADEARPNIAPVFPNKLVFVALGFLFSLAASLLTVILSDMFDKSLRDPSQVRRQLGEDVIGILPYVRKFTKLEPRAVPRLGSASVVPPPQSDWFNSSDFYEDAIYSLLSQIKLVRRPHAIRSLVVSSAAPGEGKSSCIAHMAAAHARQGHKTLLIDADLRRPSQHRYFALAGELGLADAISGNKQLSEIVQSVPGNDKLSVITAGGTGSHLYDRVGREGRGVGEAGAEGVRHGLYRRASDALLC